MALRVARGLFRVWLVLSVLWVVGVGVMTWQTFPPSLGVPRQNPPPPGYVIDQPRVGLETIDDANAALAIQSRIQQRTALWFAGLLALLPPVFVLALGSALVWAFRGFR
jgi:hypothetical protein